MAAKREKQYHIVEFPKVKKGTEDPTDVVIGLNGDVSRFKRGLLVPLTSDQQSILEHATVKTYEFNEKTKQTEFVGFVPRYPFSIVYANIPEEVYELCRIQTKEKPLSKEQIEGWLKDYLAKTVAKK